MFLILFFAIGLTVLTRCAKIQINMVNRLLKHLGISKKSDANILKEDFLTKLGREQLTRLTERGLDLPVALL